jgi:hypothetical protein
VFLGGEQGQDARDGGTARKTGMLSGEGEGHCAYVGGEGGRSVEVGPELVVCAVWFWVFVGGGSAGYSLEEGLFKRGKSPTLKTRNCQIELREEGPFLSAT